LIPSVENWLKTLDNTQKFWSPTLNFSCTGAKLVATFHTGEIDADGGKKSKQVKNHVTKKARYLQSQI